jgi:hypothetical protein
MGRKANVLAHWLFDSLRVCGYPCVRFGFDVRCVLLALSPRPFPGDAFAEFHPFPDFPFLFSVAVRSYYGQFNAV